MTSFRLAAVLALLIAGLAIAATPGVASASTAPGHTIASAGTLAVPDSASGGGGPIDFWKVPLSGGDDVQFSVPAVSGNGYTFALFAPGTTDTSFPTAKPFTEVSPNDSANAVFDLMAPYTGTFILAVCQATYSCPSVENGGGENPMSPYTFTTTFFHGVSSKVAAAETKASATIAGTRSMGVGHFESGGANGVDFWKVPLSGGDDVQFSVPAVTGNGYTFALFAPGTTDTSFPSATAIVSASPNDSANAVFTLIAPHTGTFILAVCQATYSCPSVENGGGQNPMSPYTFTTKQVGGFETRTALKLAAASVKYGHEKGFRFTASVSAIFGGSVTGKVVISDGKKTLCTAKVVHGKGFCALSSNTKLPAGKYTITGAYTGNRDASKSGGYALKVTS